MDKQTQGLIVLVIGATIFIVAGILLFIGTTEMGLFIFWVIPAMGGALLGALGNKMRNRRYE